MKKHFASAQEVVRKDVETAFGVLLSRWHILKNPCMFWDVVFIMKKVMMNAIVFQNMIVNTDRAVMRASFFE